MTVSAVSGYGSGQSSAAQGRQNLLGASSFGQFLSGTDAGSGLETPASDPAQQFVDLMKGTPEQRMFKLFLARHHLTEDQFGSLSVDDQKKLTDEFKTELKDKMRRNATADAATPVDIAV